MTSFNFNYLHKSPISKYSHIGDWGFNISIWGSGGPKQSVHNSGHWLERKKEIFLGILSMNFISGILPRKLCPQ